MVSSRLLAPKIVRITHHQPDGSLPEDRPWLEHVLLPVDPAGSAVAGLQVEVESGCPQVYTPEGEWLCGEGLPPAQDLRKTRPALSVDIPKVEVRPYLHRVRQGVQLKWKILPGESFYGFGEWFNYFRRQSGVVEMNIRDAIAISQDRETYSAIPCFLSSRGYAFFLLNSHAAQWNIQPGQGVLTITTAGPPADYIVLYGPSFKEILSQWTLLTGRPPLLPRWAFGLMVTGYPQEPQDTILERVRQHRQRLLPLDAVILDYHWEEQFHNFKWRKSLFPNPDHFISTLASLGVRLGLITTPFINSTRRPFQKKLLNTLASNLPPGLENDDERALPEYQQGLEDGYFAHPHARWWFGAGGMLDFTNPSAADWWNALLRPCYQQGAAFFKNDDGEYLPEDANSALGISGREYHNLYGFFYGRAMYDGMLTLDSGSAPRRPFIYARSVWAGSQRYPALFLGDQKPTFDFIKSTLRAGLSLGLLGFAYWTADVFGLDGKTTRETHMRYAQWALLNPVARYFWRPPQVDGTRFPWSYDAEAEENFRLYTDLRYRLLPYFQTLAWQAWQTGLPIVRPLLLEYPADPRFSALDDQYLLGADLLVAPVVQPSTARRTILLPEGEWHDFWSSQSWQGPGEIDYPAPIDRLPILVRGGSLLPFAPVQQYIPPDHRFDNLVLHAWSPYSSHLDFFDDDGLTTAYQQGEYSLTPFTLETTGDRQVVFTAHPTQGGYPGAPAARQVTLVLHRSSPPEEVMLNSAAFTGWDYNEETGETTLPITSPLEAETTLVITLTP